MMQRESVMNERRLRVIASEQDVMLQPSGEQILREEILLMCERISQRLGDASRDDPSLVRAAALVSQLRGLAC
jgi:hypothetical protein